jgi:CubicO group peptidase (beta-lactamase class C family)
MAHAHVRARLALLAAIALPLFSSAARTQGAGAAEKATVRDVSGILQPIRERNRLPGIAAAVVQGERVVAIGADGVRRRGSEERITTEDRFHLGSCTKSMTATMIATLVEEGKLEWSTTIGEIFPELDGKMRPAWRTVTLDQLLTHRAGAPADLQEGGLWGRLWQREGSPTEQRMTLVRGVLEREPESTPGTKFMYSNAGFAIAGAMAERITGKAWEDLMRERIFGPLGMESAGFGAPGTEGKLDEPLGHTEKGEPVDLGPHADNPPAIGPAGTVHCTLGDWAKYVALHLEGDRSESGKAGREAAKLLKPETFRKLHEPSGSDETKYAMGWLLAERDWAGGRVLTHNGSNTMWFCVTWIAPEKDFAVLVAANQGGGKAEKACDEAAWALIQDHLGAGKEAKSDGGGDKAGGR